MLSQDGLFAVKTEEVVDGEGKKVRVELPVWSSNVDRIFMSLGRHQHEKQGQIKKIYKILDGIIEAVGR
jgi:hypothetical protein